MKCAEQGTAGAVKGGGFLLSGRLLREADKAHHRAADDLQALPNFLRGRQVFAPLGVASLPLLLFGFVVRRAKLRLPWSCSTHFPIASKRNCESGKRIEVRI